jgi:methionyl-tRNA formyltransferase
LIIIINYTVVGVITAADKPAGRGQKLKYSAKEYLQQFKTITTNKS